MGTKEFEESLSHQDNRKYLLRLFVSGLTPRSQKAINNLKQILSQYEGQFDLEIIDIYQHPDEAKNDQITAVPTLLKMLPIPVRRFIGDMSDKEKIIVGMNLKKKKS